MKFLQTNQNSNCKLEIETLKNCNFSTISYEKQPRKPQITTIQADIEK